MDIGVFVHLRSGADVMNSFEKVKRLQLRSCQVSVWDATLYTEENAQAICTAAEGSGVRISALWAGWSGPAVWNFYDGPVTLGLVPATYRHIRMRELMQASDFAVKLGVTDIATHAGFLPENPNDPEYPAIIAALRYLARYMQDRGQYFLFETGQETPTTLVRVIEDVGTGNLGINFDTANLMLYGKANAVDAARIFGRYVRNTHCKDGEFPTDGRNLGKEKPLGQGCAQIERVMEILYSQGYNGAWTIEREISGEQQIQDIEMARNLLLEIGTRLGKA